jgi:hypothetical protein
MFHILRKRQVEKVEPPPQEPVDDLDVEEFKDEDVPTFEAFHVRRLRDSPGGPYYLAPDSAEPLPSGMWKDLDPETVEKESERIDKLRGGEEWRVGAVQPGVREFLRADGAIGRRAIQVLEGRSAESSDSS